MPSAMTMSRPLSFLLTLCLFAAFLLLLLVSLSMPIIKPLYLLEVRATPTQAGPATSIATLLRFGIWGFCATSALNEPTLLTNHGECTPAHLGYIIDPAILDLTGHQELAQAILKGLTVVFILHPITTGLALLFLLCAFPARSSHCWAIISLVIGLIVALLATAVLAVDFVLIGEMKNRVGPLTNGSFEVAFGNCPWMVLVATVLLWGAVLFSSIFVCNCCGCGRRRNWDRDEKYNN